MGRDARRFSRGHVFRAKEVDMNGYGKRVLIAEDDEGTRNTLIMALEKAGYNVYVALDGRQALEEMKRRRFDVVVTDHHMPKINGFQLILLGRLVWPDTPMVLLSGDDVSLTEMAEQGGAYGCLRKPCGAAELLGLIEDATLAVRERHSQTPVSVSLSPKRGGDERALAGPNTFRQ